MKCEVATPAVLMLVMFGWIVFAALVAALFVLAEIALDRISDRMDWEELDED